MPEGDTVWRVARALEGSLAGTVLTRCDLRVPALATVDLSGHRVEEVTPRGKHLLIRVDPGLTLHSHLRMDGSWRIYPLGERWSGGPGHQIRAVLGNDRLAAVGYRVHNLALVRRADEHTLVGHLGPDLLGPGWDLDEAVRRIRATPGRAIGDALVDQRNLAGIGNLYKSETLFLSGVDPWLPTVTVTDVAGVVDRARRLLHANRDRVGQPTTGNTRQGQQHWVYLRSGEPCRRCGTTVRRAEQGTRLEERATFWCPSCQPGPGPDRAGAATG
jgi:endonuclease-8